MYNIYQLLPMLEDDEAAYISGLVRDMTDEQARMFAQVYASRRRDPQTILLTALIGFILVAGVHRFLMNQVGMGLLYLFTGGLCAIGTIVDLVRHKTLAFEYNIKLASQIAMMVRGAAR
ncbi:MAG: TM2 domain-containing protein [Bacteroidota bacterium]|nr:TM2 domain-containing protein [Bacteroidota bacterium]